DLAQPGMGREKVLALAFRLLDLAYFRAGGEIYAQQNKSYGLATIRKEHARVRRDGSVHFHYPAKSGQVRDVVVEDPVVADLVTTLKRRRGGVEDRKSTRLNSSHVKSSYALFCWTKKTMV